MQYLKADTNTEVLIGPVVAVGDGFTPVTTLSPSTADEAELIKYGGATPLTVTDINASAMTAITGADGYYTLDLSTGNTDTEGFLTVLFNDDSLCLPVRHDFMVVNANVYDSLFAAAATDYLQTDVTQIRGKTPQVINGTCDGSPSLTNITTTLETAESLTQADSLVGRTIIFDGNSTTDLKAQAAKITAYNGGTGAITIASGAITDAPVSGDTFTIV